MKLLVLLLLGLMTVCPARAEAMEALWEQLPLDALEQQASEAGLSFRELVKALMAGDLDLSQCMSRIWQAARDAASEVWLRLAGILMFAAISELARAFCGGKHAVSTLDLLCRMAAGTVLLSMFRQASAETAQVCIRLREFTSAAAPLLTAVLTLLGAAGSAAAINPAAAIADQVAVGITTDYGLLLLDAATALAIFAGFGRRFSLDRVYKLCIGSVRWLLACCMTGYLALTGVKTLLVGAKDGIVVQSARFAVDNWMPIIGGELADTVGSVFASAILVKNAAGIAVCAALLWMTIAPVAKLAAMALMTKITAAAADLLAAQGIAGMLGRFAQVLEAMMALLAAVASLGMILAGAVVLTAAGGR